MLIVTRYTVEKVPGAYRIRARDPPMCPACGVLLSGYDTRPRRVVDGSGAVLLFQLRRLRCPVCHRLPAAEDLPAVRAVTGSTWSFQTSCAPISTTPAPS